MKHDYNAALHDFEHALGRETPTHASFQDAILPTTAREIRKALSLAPVAEQMAEALMNLYEVVCHHAKVPDQEYWAVKKAAAAFDAYEALKKEG